MYNMEKRGDRYILLVTSKQMETFIRMSERSKEKCSLMGGCDDFEVVADDDPRADMITRLLVGLVVGILPDGTSHS